MFPFVQHQVLREARRKNEQSASFVGRARKRKGLQVLLCQQYDRSEYCDLSLKVGDDKALAHHCVLAGISPYIRKMFSTDGTSGPKEVDLSNQLETIQPVTSVLEFIYHGEIQIEKSDVEGLFQVAQLFKMKDLEELCVHFLLKNLSVATCLWTWAVSVDLSIREIEEVSKDVALSRFYDTLIKSNEAMEMRATHLLHFLKQGLAKFCSEQKLEDFLKQWCEKDNPGRGPKLLELKEAAGLSTEDIQASGADGDEKDDKETNGNHVEEVLFYENGNQGVQLIYRPQKKTWFTVGIPRHLASGTVHGDGNHSLYGIGSLGEFACIPYGYREFRLLNMDSKETKYIHMDTEDREYGSGRTNKSQVLSFNDGNLYSFKEEVSTEKNDSAKSKKDQEKTGVWYERMRGAYCADSKKTWKFIFERYNMETRKWEPVCVSESEQGGFCLKVRVVIRKDGAGYIICMREPSKILIWHLTPSSGELQRLASPAANIPLRSLLADLKTNDPFDILGTDDQLLIKLGRNALVYKIQKNAWEVKQFPKDRPIRSTREVKMSLNSENEGNIYLLYKKIRSSYMEAGIYNPFKECLTEVPTVPSCYQPINIRIGLVRRCFLDRLGEATCETNIEKGLLESAEILKILKTVRSRWREEALDAMSHGESLDEADEMMWNSDGEDPEEEEERKKVAAAVLQDIAMRQLIHQSLVDDEYDSY